VSSDQSYLNALGEVTWYYCCSTLVKGTATSENFQHKQIHELATGLFKKVKKDTTILILIYFKECWSSTFVQPSKPGSLKLKLKLRPPVELLSHLFSLPQNSPRIFLFLLSIH
jgi:hypothetical protein